MGERWRDARWPQKCPRAAVRRNTCDGLCRQKAVECAASHRDRCLPNGADVAECVSCFVGFVFRGNFTELVPRRDVTNRDDDAFKMGQEPCWLFDWDLHLKKKYIP